ncbi:MAG: iron-containing alcohol dehydrogenase family protein [Planctomycetota bacterium]
MSMLRQWQFQLPTQILFGRGVARKLALAVRGNARRALLIGYRDCSRLAGAYAETATALAKSGVECAEFLSVDPEPQLTEAAVAGRFAVEQDVDCVIAIGGGSVIDTAKAAALLAASGGELAEYVDTAPNRRPPRAALPVYAVPSTAGTGAEVTSVAVFSHSRPTGTSSGDPSVPQPAKLSITAACLRPRAAFVDPELQVGMDREPTAAFATDALAHAVESRLSRAANPVSALMATRAVALVMRELPLAMGDPEAAEPREGLALAAMLAGAALNESGVTLAHSVAHALGSLLHMPHSRAVALATPLGLRFNREACVPALAELADACELAEFSPESRAERFVAAVEELLQSAGLLERRALPEESSPTELAAQLAAAAFQHTPMPLRLNPVRIDERTLAELLTQWLK